MMMSRAVTFETLQSGEATKSIAAKLLQVSQASSSSRTSEPESTQVGEGTTTNFLRFIPTTINGANTYSPTATTTTTTTPRTTFVTGTPVSTLGSNTPLFTTFAPPSTTSTTPTTNPVFANTSTNQATPTTFYTLRPNVVTLGDAITQATQSPTLGVLQDNLFTTPSSTTTTTQNPNTTPTTTPLAPLTQTTLQTATTPLTQADLGFDKYQESDIQQTWNNNCWLTSVFKTLDTNPQLRTETQNYVTLNNQGGITVFPPSGSVPPNNKAVVIPAGHITKNQDGSFTIKGTSIKGPLWTQALEYTMAAQLARQSGWSDTWIQQYPNQLQSFLNMGMESNALRLLYGDGATLTHFTASGSTGTQARTTFDTALTSFANNPTGSLFVDTKNDSTMPSTLKQKYGLVTQHSYSVENVELDTQGNISKVWVSDPLQTASFAIDYADLYGLANHGWIAVTQQNTALAA
ncbi:MAG: hypothetical protein ACKO37_06250 [Vampirovibrionales bacterium]